MAPTPLFTAFIAFAGDPSVGIKPFSYTAEIPDFRLTFADSDPLEAVMIREQARSMIKEMYQNMDGEFKATVRFSDEFEQEPPMTEKEPLLADLSPPIRGGESVASLNLTNKVTLIAQ